MPAIYDDELMTKLIDWTVAHRSAYLRSGGAKGHIMDMRFIGGFRYEPMLLLRYVGRKSGKTMITGLGYTLYRGEIVVVGSKGGSDTHPAYLNFGASAHSRFRSRRKRLRLPGANSKATSARTHGASLKPIIRSSPDIAPPRSAKYRSSH